MRREAKLLLEKSCDSLVLGIELFNRPQDRGRISGVLIQIDHGFEMLLKAAIIHRGGSIREKGASETIGFNACVRKGLSDGQIKFLTEEQAITLQAVNGMRDAAQHYLLEMSEGLFYLHIQAAVTLFKEMLSSVFQRDLASEMPARVLPISTSPATDLVAIFDSEVTEIVKLLKPGKRRRIDADARLRPLTVLNSTITGERRQPTNEELGSIGKRLLQEDWQNVFLGVSAMSITTEGSGPNLSLRFTKNEGPPFHVVPEGTPGAYTVAVRRVNELDFYNLGARDLAEKVGLTTPKLHAVVECLGLRNNPDHFKEFSIGSTTHKRYSQKAIVELQVALDERTIDSYWEEYKASRKVVS